MQCLRMLLYERLDVADSLLLEDLIDSNQDASLLDITKSIVNGCTEKLHCRREVHVRIDEWRDIISELTDIVVEDPVVILERLSSENLGKLSLRCLNLQRLNRHDEILLVVEMLLQEIQNHVTSTADVRRIHCHLTEEILAVRVDDCQRSQSVPQVV